MLREAYSPEYTANKITRLWLALAVRLFAAEATRVSSKTAAKHFCAT